MQNDKIEVFVPIETITIEQAIERYENLLTEENVKELKCLQQKNEKN